MQKQLAGLNPYPVEIQHRVFTTSSAGELLYTHKIIATDGLPFSYN